MDRPEEIEAQTIYARRKWSAERLEIPLQASKQDARAQWLKGLEAADFLPDEIHLPAWRIVTSAENATEARKRFPEWASQFDNALAREIEDFAEQFFKLEPDERRKEFTRLFNASRDNPRLHKRVSSLSPGLKLTTATAQDAETDDDLLSPDVKTLSQHLREMFLANPLQRARLSQTFLRRHADELPRWVSAAQVLKEKQSPLIDLLPEQWEELTGWDVHQRQAAAFQEGLGDRVAIQAIETEPRRSSSDDDSESMWKGMLVNRYAMFFGVWILIKVVGALISSSNSTSQPAQQLPPLPIVTSQDYMKRFDNQRQKQYEARRWIIMDEKEFQAANGEERIQELGLKENRREYWQWRARVDEHDMLLDEKIARRNELRTELTHQEGLETVWKVRHEAKLEKEENSPDLTDAQKAEHTKLRDELHEIQLLRLELQGQIEMVQGEILRLQILLAGMKASDPSDNPLDDAP